MAVLDEQDIRIEHGDEDPLEDGLLYLRGLLNVIDALYRNKKFSRPRGKNSPRFSSEELRAIADLLFFKSPYVVLKVYKRLPRRRELPLRRKAFVNHLLGDAKFNATQAARLAGYSPRSAKQIAYKLLRS